MYDHADRLVGKQAGLHVLRTVINVDNLGINICNENMWDEWMIDNL